MEKAFLRASEDVDWLCRNVGPRCTIVGAISILKRHGAYSEKMLEIIESAMHFREKPNAVEWLRFGMSYIGPFSGLDRGIEKAAMTAGLKVKATTRFRFLPKDFLDSIARGNPILLNCFRAPSGDWSHSVIAVGTNEDGTKLLTIDPNDGIERWLLSLNAICTATFVEPHKR
jgi:hypothetical protein